MKTKIYAAILCAVIVSPVYAIDQWPGQSDFDNLNGPAANNGGPYAQRPVVDFRFGRPAPQTSWQQVPSQADTTQLSPAEFSYCRQYQYDNPTRDISCSGPNLP